MRIELSESVNLWRKHATLSDQEFKILGLAAMGYSDNRIGGETGMSLSALAGIWRGILAKFGVTSKDDALAKYAEHPRGSGAGLGDDGLGNLAAREQAQKRLLSAIADASAAYVNGRQNVRQVYSRILDDLLALTQSHYGMICEVREQGGEFALGEYALTCSGWGAEEQAKYEGSGANRFRFEDLDPLFSKPAFLRELVVINDTKTDGLERRAPEGHPMVHSYMGIPVYCGLELVGVVALANRRGGYTQALAEFLRPIVSTCANLTVAWRSEASRLEKERELDAANCLMRTMVERSSSAVMYENAERRVEFVNGRFATLFGVEAAPNQLVGLHTDLVMLHSKKLFADPGQFMERVENLVDGQESCYEESVRMANGAEFLRDFVVVRSGQQVCGYFWHYRVSGSL